MQYFSNKISSLGSLGTAGCSTENDKKKMLQDAPHLGGSTQTQYLTTNNSESNEEAKSNSLNHSVFQLHYLRSVGSHHW